MNINEIINELSERISKLPRRIEPLGGQNYSYVQLDDVMGILESFDYNECIQNKRKSCKHTFVHSPICGDPSYCPKCGKTLLNDD